MKRIALFLLFARLAGAEMPAIPAARVDAAGALDPTTAAWKAAPPVSLALHRTPPLYATDPPATPEILAVQVQLLQAPGKTFVRLEWADRSRDAASLPEAKKDWQSATLVTQSEATGRFFDACAVMVPARPASGGVFPSLQMGDPQNPVLIYYYDAARGAAVMEASGRGTTRRTGRAFAAQAAYAAGRWQVAFELPELPSGTPLSVAVWNGSQSDRDGRKYFSIWYETR